MTRAKGWTCQKQTAGSKCRHTNPPTAKKCRLCGKLRPPKRNPAHRAVLKQMDYAAFVELNGGVEACGICGATQKAGGKRLHRDHDHRTGQARGLLCFRDNSALRPYMTVEWLRAALKYMERTQQ